MGHDLRKPFGQTHLNGKSRQAAQRCSANGTFRSNARHAPIRTETRGTLLEPAEPESAFAAGPWSDDDVCLARLGQRWLLYDPDGEEIPVEGFGLFGAFSPSPTAKLSRPPSPTSLANV